MIEFARIDDLVARFSRLGATRIFFKRLSENDNNKQQIYLGGSFEALSVFPHGVVTAHGDLKDPNFKADLRLFWVAPETTEEAPHAQLILYPKYPEVRLSGFLRGCRTAPNEHLRPIPRMERRGVDGRILFFGVTNDRQTFVHLAPAGSPLAKEAAATWPDAVGSLFTELPAGGKSGNDKRALLLDTLGEIHRRGFVASAKLDRNGIMQPYLARNGGGYTLEALLGIRPNGDAQPDFLGWEVKAFSTGRITLMTPEPNGGIYGQKGAEVFVRRYGRKMAGKDQLYFTGAHVFGVPSARTGLTLVLNGFDPATGKITDVNGAIQLADAAGTNTASWAFSHLLTHWNRKHASAVYVRYKKSADTPPQYRYLSPVSLGEHTDFAKYLSALARGSVVFDPGSKIDNASTAKSRVKARSQFRIKYKDLASLYDVFDIAEL